jgi:ubiquinone/menaquinone biosynthesis C-methylase UbiE
VREDRTEDVSYVKQRFDENSKFYDFSEKTLEGRLHKELEWKGIILPILPGDKSIKILDAGGGTGRLTLPLAKLGYQVTLCDLSSGMLSKAREKIQKEGLSERVEIREADISALPFQDESFGLVICLHGAFCNADSFKAAEELTRVLKRGGTIILDTLSRYWAATSVLTSDPDFSLKLVKSEKNYAYDVHGDWQRVFSPDEFQALFEQKGLRNIRVLGSFYQLPDLFPKEILDKGEWDKEFVTQLGRVTGSLSKIPSVTGMARELILVGEKPGM